MIRLCAAVLTVPLLLLGGCAPAPVSTLQRFDSLRADLSATGRVAGELGADVSWINRGMSHDDRKLIVRSSARLAADARHLAGAARRLRQRVGREEAEASNRFVRTYLRLTLVALVEQANEAILAKRLAEIVRSDPLLVSGRDAARAVRQSRQARGAAAAAIRAVTAARRLKRRHVTSFRYVPVARKS